MNTNLQPAAPPAAQPLVRQPRTIADVIQTDHVREQMKLALPHWLPPERMMRIAITTINRSSDLQKCTAESLLSSLMTASAMGIEPDGRHGHLIARFNSRLGKHECSFQADYKGLVALVRKSGDVSDVYADYVCENDVFSVTKGLHRDLVHEIDIRKPRGEFLGAYSVILYRDGAPGFDFMGKEEIDAIRERSDGWKAFKAGRIASTPWGTDYAEMAKKTVLKRLLKLADLSGETHQRVALVDVDATVTPSQLTIAPAPIPRAQVPQVPPPMSLQESTTEEPLTPPLPEPPQSSPRRAHRATRQAKAQEVPATPPPASDDMPLPGGEPEPPPQQKLAEPEQPETQQPAPVPPPAPEEQPPARKLAPPTPGNNADALASFRAQHPDGTDDQLFRVLTRYALVGTATKLSEVSTANLERAKEDPDTIGGEVRDLIEAEG